MSLLRVKPGIAGIVLAEFDRAYTNPYYNSHLDHAENLYAESLAAAAEATAHALHVLASHVQPHMALKVGCRHALTTKLAFHSHHLFSSMASHVSAAALRMPFVRVV